MKDITCLFKRFVVSSDMSWMTTTQDSDTATAYRSAARAILKAIGAAKLLDKMVKI
jgi:hypothetical protein